MKQRISFSAIPNSETAVGTQESNANRRAENRSWASQWTVRRLLLWFGLFLVLALLINWGLPYFQPHVYHGTVLQATETVQDFTLDSTLGKPLKLSAFRGKYVLLYFGYTFCPDVCPLTLSDLQKTVEALGKEADQIQVLFVTVDPARDTVAQLASYLPHFNPSFIGMTGDEEHILQAATQFGIFYDIHEATVEGYYTVDHTSTVVVVDPKGYPKLIFPYGIGSAEMTEDLRYLMR